MKRSNDQRRTALPASDEDIKTFVSYITEIDSEGVIRGICGRHGALLRELRTDRLEKHIVRARHAVMEHLHKNFGWSYSHIARTFGRDHATVRSSVLEEKEPCAPSSTEVSTPTGSGTTQKRKHSRKRGRS